MKQRDDKFYALITPELLFNLNKKFKNAYTPWVYIYIRLDYINNIKHSPDQFFKIDRKAICEFFDVHPATISRAFDELLKNGLMEEQNRKYKVPFKLDETFFKEIEGYPEYIMISNNFLIDYNTRIKSEYEKSGKKDRTPIKVLEIFHYLLTKNHHIMVETPVLSSKETAESIYQSLNHDENCVKDYLGVLQTMGYIEMDEKYNVINTVYGYGKCLPFKKNYIDKSRKVSNIQNINTGIKEVNQEDFIYNENIESISEVSDTFKKPELITNCNLYSEDEEAVTKNGNVEEPKPEPVTDFERIRHIVTRSNGNREKLLDLLVDYKIDPEIFKEYYNTHGLPDFCPEKQTKLCA